jgi:hypothetical protein
MREEIVLQLEQRAENDNFASTEACAIPNEKEEFPKSDEI